jgi:lipid-A-disaccharide synthase
MRIFISAGEPSGDLHGSNLVRALQERQPGVECIGFGGERMEAAGCRLLYPLTRLAVMWFLRVLANAPTFLKLLSQADRYFRHHRPDAVVLIDYPGFNWWIARRAHFHGIPVFYFVPPQLWAWAGWRVKKMQRWVDRVLCSLPFEPEWYRQRGVDAEYVGHPYYDELIHQQFDSEFVGQQRAKPGEIIGILPGSRNQELTNNLSTLIRAAGRVHAARPDVRFLVACFTAAQRDRVAEKIRDKSLPMEVHVGRTPEIIQLSRMCMAVSGSVGLELLYQGKPTVVLYRISPLDMRICRLFKTAPYISLVNLLAGEEVFPEFLTDKCESQAMSSHFLHWLEDESAYSATVGKLEALRARVAQPGACERAAAVVLDSLKALPFRGTQASVPLRTARPA